MSKRMDEFITYHNKGDGECNTMVIAEYIRRKNLSTEDKFDLVYFFSITYCVESAILLLRSKKDIFNDPEKWAAENKSKILFQSDRKYIRMKDSFSKCLCFLVRELAGKREALFDEVKAGNLFDVEKAVAIVENWPLFGRFSAFLFLEAFIEAFQYQATQATIVWKYGNTATSGLMNLFGYDAQANEFDKFGIITKPLTADILDKMIAETQERVQESGGNSDITRLETSLCAYRKFFKGSRYNGYYLDRMLEELFYFEEAEPEITRELFEIREKLFEKKYLGEKNNWRGIRKDMKKLYKNTGLIF